MPEAQKKMAKIIKARHDELSASKGPAVTLVKVVEELYIGSKS